MQQELSGRVNRIRSNKMSFANDGMELSVNIPDTFDVQDTFQALVTTIVSQQDLIHKLQSDLSKAVEEHRKTKDAFTKSIEQLMEGQTKLLQQLSETNSAVQNISYNIQGFDEKTSPAGAGNINLNGQGNIYLTDLSGNKHQVELVQGKGRVLSWGGAVRGQGILANIKSMSKKDRATFYKSVPTFDMPKSVKDRWRWALRKVLLMNRRNKLKIGVSRAKNIKGSSLLDRLSNLEFESISIPERISKKMDKLLKIMSDKFSTDINNLSDQQKNDKKELLAFCDNLKKGIENMGQMMNNFGQDLSHLREQLRREEEKRELLGKNILDSDTQFINRRLNQVTTKTSQIFKLLEGLQQSSSSLLSNASPESSTLGELFQQSQQVRYLTMTYSKVRTAVEGLEEGLQDIAQHITEKLNIVKPHERQFYEDCQVRMSNMHANVESSIDETNNALQNISGYESQIHSRIKELMDDNSAVEQIKSAVMELEALKASDNVLSKDIESLHSTIDNLNSEIQLRVTASDATTIAKNVVEAQAPKANLLDEINQHIEEIVKNLMETQLSKFQRRAPEINCTKPEFKIIHENASKAPELGDKVMILTGTYENFEGVITGMNVNTTFDSKGAEVSETIFKIQVDPDSESQRKVAKRIEELSSGYYQQMAEKLRIEIDGLASKIEILQNDKEIENQIENLNACKADVADLDRKVDINAVETIEKSIKDMIEKIGSLKENQLSELKELKQNMKANLMKSIQSAIEESKKNEPNISLLTTKALCLGCGRETHSRSMPYYVHPQSTLHSSSDTNLKREHSLRSGPPAARPPSRPDLHQPSINDELSYDNTLNAGPSVSSEITDLDKRRRNEEIIYVPSDPVLRPTRVMSAKAPVRELPFESDSDERIKPLYRGKGFPAKKSTRAETTFGANRFELSPLDISRSLSTIITYSNNHGSIHTPGGPSASR